MALQALDEFIVVDNGVGNSAEDVGVHLYLLIQITCNGGQIVE